MSATATAPRYRLEWVISNDPHFAVYGRQTGQLLCYAREPGLCRAIQALGGEQQGGALAAVGRAPAHGQQRQEL